MNQSIEMKNINPNTNILTLKQHSVAETIRIFEGLLNKEKKWKFSFSYTFFLVILILHSFLFTEIAFIHYSILFLFIYFKFRTKNRIHKDLKGRQYFPIRGVIIDKNITKKDDGMGTSTLYQINLNLDKSDYFLTKDMQENLQLKMPLSRKADWLNSLIIEIDIYNQLEIGETLFFLVGQNSQFWYCTHPAFGKKHLGTDFFKEMG